MSAPRGPAAAPPTRTGQREAGEEHLTRATRVEGPDATEVHLAARPAPGAPDFAAAVRGAWAALFAALQEQGGSPRDLLAERIFYSDIAAQFDQAEGLRREAHGGAGRMPAATHVQQPPARPGQPIEIQAQALLPGTRGAPALAAVPGLPAGASGTEAHEGSVRRLRLAGIVGGGAGDGLFFAAQADRMFARSAACLGSAGLAFRQVARTWIFLQDVDRDYAEMNRSRRAFFEVHGVQPVPASTGIRGGPHPPDRLLTLDLEAFGGLAPGAMRPIHSPGMNEAPTYGSDFSRGMRVETNGRVLLYISGTASIDDAGQVAHQGDPAAQAARMLHNVRDLLRGQGAGWGDVVTAVTYLKRASDRDALLAACAAEGLPGATPHTVCVADVCRPEWLCEMEALAILA